MRCGVIVCGLAWPSVLALSLAASACGDRPQGGEHDGSDGEGVIRFFDVTSETGLDMTLTSGEVPATQILEVKGGGIGLLDYDVDGDLDVFVPNGATLDDPEHGPGWRLFDNEAGRRFRDVTGRAGLDEHRWGMGVAVADVDADGYDDIYVTCFGPNALLHNVGGGTFEELAAAAGVDHPSWGMGSAFGDVDGDGDLDLYVANYLEFDPRSPPPPGTFKGVPVFGGPMGLEPQPDVLFQNQGDGTFVDVTASSGCAAVEPAFGLGVVILDFDLDGHQEILVGNDSMPNFLFDDAPGGQASPRRLVDRGFASGISCNGDGANQATMGIAVADVDSNGLPDVFTTNFSSDTNTLHMNADGWFFDDRTSLFGLREGSHGLVGWASMFFDFDHDGDEDLLAFNGHTYPHATLSSLDSDARQPPLLYAREGTRFRRVSPRESGPWLAEPHVDRSAAFGDLDGDGDVDVVVCELNGPVRVLRNVGAAGAWLIVELRDGRPGSGNRRGLGARVEVLAAGTTWTRWIFSGGSYLAASDASAHFGLGQLSRPLEVRVTWPDGHVQHVAGVEPRQRLVVARDA